MDPARGAQQAAAENADSFGAGFNEEYLALLEERNRILSKLKNKKSKEEKAMERREQGFSLYTRGANEEGVKEKRRKEAEGRAHSTSARDGNSSRGQRKTWDSPGGAKEVAWTPQKAGLSNESKRSPQPISDEERGTTAGSRAAVSTAEGSRVGTASSRGRAKWQKDSLDIKGSKGVKVHLKPPATELEGDVNQSADSMENSNCGAAEEESYHEEEFEEYEEDADDLIMQQEANAVHDLLQKSLQSGSISELLATASRVESSTEGSKLSSIQRDSQTTSSSRARNETEASTKPRQPIPVQKTRKKKEVVELTGEKVTPRQIRPLSARRAEPSSTPDADIGDVRSSVILAIQKENAALSPAAPATGRSEAVEAENSIDDSFGKKRRSTPQSLGPAIFSRPQSQQTPAQRSLEEKLSPGEPDVHGKTAPVQLPIRCQSPEALSEASGSSPAENRVGPGSDTIEANQSTRKLPSMRISKKASTTVSQGWLETPAEVEKAAEPQLVQSNAAMNQSTELRTSGPQGQTVIVSTDEPDEVSTPLPSKSPKIPGQQKPDSPIDEFTTRVKSLDKRKRNYLLKLLERLETVDHSFEPDKFSWTELSEGLVSPQKKVSVADGSAGRGSRTNGSSSKAKAKKSLRIAFDVPDDEEEEGKPRMRDSRSGPMGPMSLPVRASTDNNDSDAAMEDDAAVKESLMDEVFQLPVEACFKILSTWGHKHVVGLTEIDFLDENGEKLDINKNDVLVRNLVAPFRDIGRLVNGKGQTILEREMCLFSLPKAEKLEVMFSLPTGSKVGSVKVWNYNRSQADLNKGVKDAELYVNGVLYWKGEVSKGTGSQVKDFSFTINVNEPIPEPAPEDPPKPDNTVVPMPASRDDDKNKKATVTLAPSVGGKPPSGRSSVQQPMAESNQLQGDEQVGSGPIWLRGASRDGSRSSAAEDLNQEVQHGRRTGSAHSNRVDIEPSAAKSSERALPSRRSRRSMDTDGAATRSVVSSKASIVRFDTDTSGQDVTQDVHSSVTQPSVLDDSGRSSSPVRVQKGKQPRSRLQESYDSLSLFQSTQFGRIGSHPLTKDSLDANPAAAEGNEKSKGPRQQGEDPLLQMSAEDLDAALFGADGVPGPAPALAIAAVNQKMHQEPQPAEEADDGASMLIDDMLEAVSMSGPAPAPAQQGATFEIPRLPEGRFLTVNILSTWGDPYYVGLCGIDIFDGTGRMMSSQSLRGMKISATPADINVLPGYSSDPRVVDNVIDGVSRTCDDLHSWLAPFTKGKDHAVKIDFGETLSLSMLRFWNYNKSRIHSGRGARYIEVKLDEKHIFKGEIRRAPGVLEGSENCAECILFTVDESVLANIELQDMILPKEDDAQGLVSLTRPPTRDSRTVPTEEEVKAHVSDVATQLRPKTSAVRRSAAQGPPSPDVDSMLAEFDMKTQTREAPLRQSLTKIPAPRKSVRCRRIKLNCEDTWGDRYFLGLTGVEVLDESFDVIAVKPTSMVVKPQSINDIPGHSGDYRTPDKLVDGDNLTMDDRHMWLVPFTPGGDHTITIDLGYERTVSGLRLWNYNKNYEDTDRGVKRLSIYIDGELASPSEGILLRKAPGNMDFDFSQFVRLETRESTATTSYAIPDQVRGAYEQAKAKKNHNEYIRQDYETSLLPYGTTLKFVFLSTWGDPFYFGLNGIEIFDACGEKILIPTDNIVAVPSSVNELPGMSKDVRTVDKIVDGVNDTRSDDHIWLAPFDPDDDHYMYIFFEEPVSISAVRIWNYSKTPARGVEEIEILMDDFLIYKGFIRKASDNARQPLRPQSILFTNNEQIVEREKPMLALHTANTEQEVLCIDEGVVKVYAENRSLIQHGDRPTTAAGPRPSCN